jgi:hypothetical protein
MNGSSSTIRTLRVSVTMLPLRIARQRVVVDAHEASTIAGSNCVPPRP